MPCSLEVGGDEKSRGRCCIVEEGNKWEGAESLRVEMVSSTREKCCIVQERSYLIVSK